MIGIFYGWDGILAGVPVLRRKEQEHASKPPPVGHPRAVLLDLDRPLQKRVDFLKGNGVMRTNALSETNKELIHSHMISLHT